MAGKGSWALPYRLIYAGFSGCDEGMGGRPAITMENPVWDAAMAGRDWFEKVLASHAISSTQEAALF